MESPRAITFNTLLFNLERKLSHSTVTLKKTKTDNLSSPSTKKAGTRKNCPTKSHIHRMRQSICDQTISCCSSIQHCQNDHKTYVRYSRAMHSDIVEGAECTIEYLCNWSTRNPKYGVDRPCKPSNSTSWPIYQSEETMHGRNEKLATESTQ